MTDKKQVEHVEIDNMEDFENLIIKNHYYIKEIFKNFDVKSVDNKFVAYYNHWFYEIIGKLTFLENVRIGNNGILERGSGMCEREEEAVIIYITIDVPDPNSRYRKEVAEKTETEYKINLTTDCGGYSEIDAACVLQVIENLNEDDKNIGGV